MIELTALEEMFDSIRENTDWDIDGPMLWGYFFLDPSRSKLEQLASILQENGYNVVDIYVPEHEEGEAESHCLHVERVESHTARSLDDRNHEFYALAGRLGVALYDGMDVGPTE